MNITVTFGELKPLEEVKDTETVVRAYNEGKPVNPRDIFSPHYFRGGAAPSLPSRRSRHAPKNK